MEKLYGNFIRQHIITAWDKEKYPFVTQKYILSYIVDRLKEISEEEFCEATKNPLILAFKNPNSFVTNHTWDKNELIAKLNDKINENKCKRIERFIKGETVNPETERLNEYAVLFDVPIKSFAEFIEFEAAHQHITPPTEHNYSSETPKIQSRRHRLRYIGAAAIVSTAVVFGIIVFPIFTAQSKNSTASDTTNFVEKIQKSSYKVENTEHLTAYAKQSEITPKSKDPVISKLKPNELIFNTYRILNDECITSDIPWTFTTDVNGEDMYSKIYGTPYCNDIELVVSSANRTPIANKSITIRFRIINNTENLVKISDFLLKIDSVISADSKHISYNLYRERSSEEEVFRIKLSPEKTSYPFYTNVYEIKPKSEVFFLVEARFPEDEKECTNSIYRFHIELACVDNTLIRSDKNYFLAWKSI